MNAEETVQHIGRIGIVPVIRANSAAEAMLAVEALEEGGIPIMEITMTVPGAVELIRKVSAAVGSRVLVGAGTVLNSSDASACLDAGAEFLVSPGLCLPVLQVAQRCNKLALPGALTPTELIAAMAAGASAVKIFPCSSAGGAKHIKALRGPFPNVALIPTGGVNASNVADYFAAGAFAVGVGGELVNAEALRAGKKHVVSDAARELAAALHVARIPKSSSTK